MGLKKYVADADTTIVNAFPPNLQTRATGANFLYQASAQIELMALYPRVVALAFILNYIMRKPQKQSPEILN